MPAPAVIQLTVPTVHGVGVRAACLNQKYHHLQQALAGGQVKRCPFIVVSLIDWGTTLNEIRELVQVGSGSRIAEHGRPIPFQLRLLVVVSPVFKPAVQNLCRLLPKLRAVSPLLGIYTLSPIGVDAGARFTATTAVPTLFCGVWNGTGQHAILVPHQFCQLVLAFLPDWRIHFLG